MIGQAQSGFIDEVEGKLPPVLKWCLGGAGAAAGCYYARATKSAIPFSYIVAGAAIGFCLAGLTFLGLRFLKLAAIIGICVVVLNYAVLIPYGYGDHMPGWLAAVELAATAALEGLARLLSSWGRELR